MSSVYIPRFRHAALAVWARNLRVWRSMLASSILINFGEPFLYLVGLGFGLGMYVGGQMEMPYLTFLASGLLAASAMNTASFEALYSVFTRMVPQKTYDAMLTSPLEIQDIIAGEILWCATKSTIHGAAILAVAAGLGAVSSWQSLWTLPIHFLTAITFTTPALIMTARASSYAFFSYYTTLVMMPLMLLSGVFYPITALPASLQGILHWLPLIHSVELIRPLMAGQPVHDVALHIAVLTAYAVVGYLIALRMIRGRLTV